MNLHWNEDRAKIIMAIYIGVYGKKIGEEIEANSKYPINEVLVHEAR